MPFKIDFNSDFELTFAFDGQFIEIPILKRISEIRTKVQIRLGAQHFRIWGNNVPYFVFQINAPNFLTRSLNTLSQSSQCWRHRSANARSGPVWPPSKLGHGLPVLPILSTHSKPFRRYSSSKLVTSQLNTLQGV